MRMFMKGVSRTWLAGATIALCVAITAAGSSGAAGHHTANLDKLAGAYAAIESSLDNKNHKDSKFVVFKTKGGYGIGFDQPRGKDRGSILCFKTDPSGDGKSLSCEVDPPGCGKGVTETLRIGLPDSKICKDERFNKCKGRSDRCACFVIKHERLVSRQATDITAEKKPSGGPDAAEIRCPPGAGAGSGGAH